jgi:hypothetical protein
MYSLYLKTVKRQCIYSSIEDSEVILVFNEIMQARRNCQVLSEQTSDSSTFLNVMCHLE